MGIELQMFESGDTDYIQKLNSDMAIIRDAINVLQAAQVLSGASADLALANWMAAKFDGVTTIIGRLSYIPTEDGTDLIVAVGSAYLASAATIVTSVETTLAFSGQGANTYYLHVNNVGTVTFNTDSTEALYSVAWTGSAFGDILRVANAAFAASEEDASRRSTTLSTAYLSLDNRLEALEALALEANELAYEAASAAGVVARYKHIHLTLDGGGAAITAGVKAQIQCDFEGEIVGWSIIADQVGDIEIEVSKLGSSAPDAAPSIPNPVTNLISASAPIALSGAQSAAEDAAGVASWTTTIDQWDVVQFNVVANVDITRAILYLRVLEA